MGRPERRIDGEAGPVQAFAAELRALRESAGRPKYAALARRTGRSQTALSEAAGGRRFPTWETVAAFVAGCDGDLEVWRVRWEQVAAAVGTPAPATDSDGTATAVAEDTPDRGVSAVTAAGPVPAAGPVEGRWRRRTVTWLAATTAATVTALAGLIHAIADARPPTSPDPDPATPPSRVAVADGADPKDSGCADDPQVLSVDTVEVNLGRQALGVLELRYAPRCGVSWPRFLPYAVERIPYGTAIHVDVRRPADGAAATFTADYAGTGVFGNLLHSARDCVLAEVRIEMPEDPTGVATGTACVRGRTVESGP